MSWKLSRFALFLAVLLAPVLAMAQGVLIHIQPDDHVPLPRPIVIYPPHPWPHPRPMPTPPRPPESTYKIKITRSQRQVGRASCYRQVTLHLSTLVVGKWRSALCFRFLMMERSIN